MSNKKHRHPGGPLKNPKIMDYINRMERNGITLEDLKKNYELGYDAGKKDGEGWAYDVAYGSVMLALRREFGFGHDRIGRVAMAAAAIQLEYLATDEMYERLKQECGVELPRMRDIIDGGGVCVTQ